MAIAAPNPTPSPPKFRIDVAIHDLGMNNVQGLSLAASIDLELPEPVFPLRPERLAYRGPKCHCPILAPEKKLRVFCKRFRHGGAPENLSDRKESFNILGYPNSPFASQKSL